VILSSPFNLQSGISRKIIERICHKPENGVILTGFCPESKFYLKISKAFTIFTWIFIAFCSRSLETLSKEIQIQKQQKTIKSLDGKDIPFNMSVMNISFSAHADLN